MKRRLLVPAVCALLALPTGLAACGGDDDEDTTATSAPAATTTEEPSGGTTGAAAGEGETIQVSMKDIKYTPREVTAKVGDKIVWTNDDPIPHTVTAEKGETFDSGNVNSGDTYEYTPRKAGEISYVCTIHPNQTGTLTVTE